MSHPRSGASSPNDEPDGLGDGDDGRRDRPGPEPVLQEEATEHQHQRDDPGAEDDGDDGAGDGVLRLVVAGGRPASRPEPEAQEHERDRQPGGQQHHGVLLHPRPGQLDADGDGDGDEAADGDPEPEVARVPAASASHGGGHCSSFRCGHAPTRVGSRPNGRRLRYRNAGACKRLTWAADDWLADSYVRCADTRNGFVF